MKKLLLVSAFLTAALSVFGQSIFSVGILPFETFTDAENNPVSVQDAALATTQVINVLNTSNTLVLRTGNAAGSADYVVRGRISRLSDRQNNQIVLTATTSDTAGKTLNTSRAQASSLDAISMPSFCAQIVSNIPYPTYYLGRWQSAIDTIDGPLTCIMEFLPDRTVRVERFDTWEHNKTNSLRYQAIGTGTYSFTGHHLYRIVNAGGRQVRGNATFGINLTLEDALPKYSSLSAGSLVLLFEESNTGFELFNEGIPCGDNFTGPSVYPGANVYYTRFTRIR